MAVVVALLFGVVMVRSEYAASCYNGTVTSVSLRPSADDIGGRYEVQFCTAADRSVTKWDLSMSFLSSPDARHCTYEELGERGLGVSHSISTELISLDLNCTRVCFSKYLDLMFRGCYHLYNKLSRGKIFSEPYNTYYYADNNIPGPEYFKNAVFVKELDFDDTVVFNWYQGHIPITEYDIEMQNVNASNYEWADVRGNCSGEASARVVRCELRLREGCYRLQLTHRGAWAAGLLQAHRLVQAHFCHAGAKAPVVGASGPRLVWAVAAACVALAAAALAALLACHSRLARKLRRRVLDYWLRSAAEREAAPPPPSSPPLVLVLYAREAAAERAVALLLRLLSAAAPGRVVDVHSSAALGLAAAAPGDWVRGAMAAEGARLLLLQTPLLACLARPQPPHGADPLTLSEPLLPSRAVYRAPQFGDTLLQFALRLLADAPAALDPAEAPYTKYFLATFPELATEVFPHVVPFRRYELPAAAAQLLADLCPDRCATDQPDQPDQRALLAEFSSAAAAFVDHVRTHENYLADELIFV